MTAAALSTWLRAHYGRGAKTIHRLRFVADVDATLQALSAEPISLHDLNNWLARNPPEQIAGIGFDELLALVLKRRDNPTPPAKIYTVRMALDERENRILLKTAKRAHSTPEQFLELCLRIGFEDQMGLDAE